MKKSIQFLVSILLTTGFIGFFITRMIMDDQMDIYQGAITRSSFLPEKTLFVGLWLLVLTISGIALYFVISNPVQINRRKNVTVNFLILLGSWFAWTFILFAEANLVGVLVLAITAFILSLLVIFMFWLVNHRAGEILIPAVVWNIFLIVLSISLRVLN
ncbi:MAG: hypothetical protein GX933_09355 [Chloroflexi bacterium]|nr:hypothetical protein [Chloroflexota bacterium]